MNSYTNLNIDGNITKSNSIYAEIIGLLQNACEEARKMHSCLMRCEKCIVVYLNKMTGCMSCNGNHEEKEIKQFLIDFPATDKKKYKTELMNSIMSLLLVSCKQCENHDEKANICPGNISMTLIEVLLTKETKTQKIMEIMLSKSISLRIKRISNFDIDIGTDIMKKYKQDIIKYCT